MLSHHFLLVTIGARKRFIPERFTVVSIVWPENFLGYLSEDIICSESFPRARLRGNCELRRKDNIPEKKYLSIFSLNNLVSPLGPGAKKDGFFGRLIKCRTLKINLQGRLCKFKNDKKFT